MVGNALYCTTHNNVESLATGEESLGRCGQFHLSLLRIECTSVRIHHHLSPQDPERSVCSGQRAYRPACALYDLRPYSKGSDTTYDGTPSRKKREHVCILTAPCSTEHQEHQKQRPLPRRVLLACVDLSQ